jgi:hypothetical protein
MPATRRKMKPLAESPQKLQSNFEDFSPLRNLFEISRTKVSGILRIPRGRKSFGFHGVVNLSERDGS